jgi:hypothetical protein
MASITTILGTDSVSSSRIVINNNFDALNTELGDIAAVLNTTSSTLTLSGNITGGTLTINNGTIDTFKVTTTEVIANVEATFNQKAFFTKGIVTSIEENVQTLPTTGYDANTYVLDASQFTSPIVLADAENGQEITIIPSGADISFDATNIVGATAIDVVDGGSITFRYSSSLDKFYVISAMNSTVVY